jgi:hypothetical protein
MAGHHRNMGNKRGTGKFGFAGFRLRNSQLCVCAGKSNFFRVHLYLALAAVFQRVLMATLEAAAANPDPHALPGNGFNIVLFAAAVLLAFNPPTEIQHLHPAFQRDPTVVLIWLTKLRYKAAAAVLWVNAGGEIALRPGTSVADQVELMRAGRALDAMMVFVVRGERWAGLVGRFVLSNAGVPADAQLALAGKRCREATVRAMLDLRSRRYATANPRGGGAGRGRGRGRGRAPARLPPPPRSSSPDSLDDPGSDSDGEGSDSGAPNLAWVLNPYAGPARRAAGLPAGRGWAIEMEGDDGDSDGGWTATPAQAANAFVFYATKVASPRVRQAARACLAQLGAHPRCAAAAALAGVAVEPPLSYAHPDLGRRVSGRGDAPAWMTVAASVQTVLAPVDEPTLKNRWCLLHEVECVETRARHATDRAAEFPPPALNRFEIAAMDARQPTAAAVEAITRGWYTRAAETGAVAANAAHGDRLRAAAAYWRGRALWPDENGYKEASEVLGLPLEVEPLTSLAW